VCILGLVAFLCGFLLTALRSNPGAAWRRTLHVSLNGISEFRQMSLRRVMSMARLAVKESVRRNVLVVFAVFAVILLFASWYLDVESDNPSRLYLSFVLKATNAMLILLAIFLSAFSLPNDIRNKTIYTIVTKPVRPWEIIFGRIVGFMGVCSVLLAAMGLFSYVFVRRGVHHRHDIDVASIEKMTDETRGRTSQEQFHRHDFELSTDGWGETDARRGHFHRVEIDPEISEKGSNNSKIGIVGPPEGALMARVPIQGELRFLDRSGQPSAKGINVGKEWFYRGYIEGGTLGAGIFRFRNLKSRDFANGLPLEMTIRVFRTYIGEIERGILGSILVRNPNPALWSPQEMTTSSRIDADTAVESEEIPITATDFTRFKMTIPRRINARMASDGSYREVDLFESLTHNGELEIVVRCAERSQYYGLAATDLYIRSADKMFWINFVKSFATMWLKLLVVISFGVMFSTFLNGPVAMLTTLGSIVLGYFSKTIVDVASGQLEGGGPGEAAMRLLTQTNLTDQMGGGLPMQIVQGVDSAILIVMRGFSFLMPNFRDYAEYGGMDTVRFVASGFDIPLNVLGQHALMALGYTLVTACAAYYFLKTKEIGA
jgi:hypothetical protein